MNTILETVVAGIILALLGLLAKWTWPRTTGMRRLIWHWLADNAAYVGRGLRYVAVLDCNGETLQADLTVSKRTPPKGEGDIRRLRGPVTSHVLELPRRFAWRATHRWAWQCASSG